MTPRQLKRIIATEWRSQAAAARALGVIPQTVGAWCRGENAVPAWAIKLIECLAAKGLNP